MAYTLSELRSLQALEQQLQPLGLGLELIDTSSLIDTAIEAAELEDVQDQLRNTERRLEDARWEIDLLRGDLSGCKDEIKELEEKVSKLRDEKTQLEVELAAAIEATRSE
jgi:peptidoglycan hydrolase CwlO-like protein